MRFLNPFGVRNDDAGKPLRHLRCQRLTRVEPRVRSPFARQMRSLTAKRRPQHTVLMCENCVLRPQRGAKGNHPYGPVAPKSRPLRNKEGAGAGQQKRPVGRSQQGVNLRGTTCFHAPISRTWYAPYSSLTRKTASLEVLFGETARGGIPQLFPSALSAKGTALCAGMPVASLPLQRLFLFIIAVFGGMSNDFRGILSLRMTKKVPHLSHAHAGRSSPRTRHFERRTSIVIKGGTSAQREVTR